MAANLADKPARTHRRRTAPPNADCGSNAAFEPTSFRRLLETASRRGSPSAALETNLRWGRLSRLREFGVVDLVEVQFSSHGRAAFRLNACAVPKDGLRTAGGRRMAEGLEAEGLHNHFQTRARLRLTAIPVVSAFADWFSVWPRPHRTRTQRDYDALVLGIVGVVSEIDVALREGRLGPHIRHVVLPEKALTG